MESCHVKSNDVNSQTQFFIFDHTQVDLVEQLLIQLFEELESFKDRLELQVPHIRVVQFYFDSDVSIIAKYFVICDVVHLTDTFNLNLWLLCLRVSANEDAHFTYMIQIC